jgi:hypothetical protein
VLLLSQERSLQKFCRLMKQDLEDKKNKKGSADSVNVVDGEFDDNEAYADVLSISLGKNSLIDSWVLDSACSYHICPNRMWFNTFKSCNASTVLVGNDARCKAIGLGTIKVKMFDGIVRILTNVRYVPNLKKNLISLGTLDSLGNGYSAKNGVMKITKGAMVIMKGNKIGNLYKLLQDTITSGATVSISAKPNDDNTILWLMQLGHVNWVSTSIVCMGSNEESALRWRLKQANVFSTMFTQMFEDVRPKKIIKFVTSNLIVI